MHFASLISPMLGTSHSSKSGKGSVYCLQRFTSSQPSASFEESPVARMAPPVISLLADSRASRARYKCSTAATRSAWFNTGKKFKGCPQIRYSNRANAVMAGRVQRVVLRVADASHHAFGMPRTLLPAANRLGFQPGQVAPVDSVSFSPDASLPRICQTGLFCSPSIPPFNSDQSA